MDLCLAVERRPVSQFAKRWWEKEVLDMDRMQTEAWEAEWEEGKDEMDGMATETN